MIDTKKIKITLQRGKSQKVCFYDTQPGRFGLFLLQLHKKKLNIECIDKKIFIQDEIKIVCTSYGGLLHARPKKISLDVAAHRFARMGLYETSFLISNKDVERVRVELQVSVVEGEEFMNNLPQSPKKALLDSAFSFVPYHNIPARPCGEHVIQKGELPVVVAVWKRADKLKRMIDDLKKQSMDSHLILWVNNPEIEERVRSTIDDETTYPISAFFSTNVGGFGRFYAAKALSAQSDKVIFIDDDQRIAKDSLELMVRGHKQKEIAGSWAFQFQHPQNYWLKKQLEAGEKADYIGTGGMIAETKLFQDRRLFQEIPLQYWFVEDLWLSWFAQKHYGYSLRSIYTAIQIEKDGNDQMISLVDKKIDFFQYLTSKGAPWSERLNKISSKGVSPRQP